MHCDPTDDRYRDPSTLPDWITSDPFVTDGRWAVSIAYRRDAMEPEPEAFVLISTYDEHDWFIYDVRAQSFAVVTTHNGTTMPVHVLQAYRELERRNRGTQTTYDQATLN